jgi:hypothetical protein
MEEGGEYRNETFIYDWNALRRDDHGGSHVCVRNSG